MGHKSVVLVFVLLSLVISGTAMAGYYTFIASGSTGGSGRSASPASVGGGCTFPAAFPCAME